MVVQVSAEARGVTGELAAMPFTRLRKGERGFDSAKTFLVFRRT
jgi:hypothetical protein